jgi:hypothetical protein
MSKSEVFKGISNTTIESSIRKRFTISKKFKRSIYRSARGLAKKINNILSLGKKKTRRVTRNCNIQKMMKKTKISHRKLRTKMSDNAI